MVRDEAKRKGVSGRVEVGDQTPSFTNGQARSEVDGEVSLINCYVSNRC